MINWCAYCQSYIGESDPFDDFTFTHGICNSCANTRVYENNSNTSKALELADYYENLRQAVIARNYLALRQSYLKAKVLGVRALDFTIGVIQPLLYEVGELWSQGKVTIEDQKVYSQISDKILSLIHESLADLQVHRQSTSPHVLLLAAPGNLHHFGLRLVELYLVLRHCPCHVLVSLRDSSEAIEAINRLSPEFIGVSVSLPEQISLLLQIKGRLADAGFPGSKRLFTGGYAYRMPDLLVDDSEISIIRDIRALDSFLGLST